MMRELLQPLFGEGGAGVAQFIITLLVVLALIAVVVWLVMRYGSGSLGSPARAGRAPRLAVLDALSIDSRRRLVLVRRDNVEHLLLIGGPSDIVVEPTIVRTIPAGARQRPPQAQPQGQAPAQGLPPTQAIAAPHQPAAPPQAMPQQAAPQPMREAPPAPQIQRAQAYMPVPPAPQQQPAAAMPQPAPPQRRIDALGGSEPIPFPQPPRAQPAPRAPRAEPPAPVFADDITIEPMRRSPAALQAAASAHFTETVRPTRIESVFSLSSALDDIAEEPQLRQSDAPIEPLPEPEAWNEPAPSRSLSAAAESFDMPPEPLSGDLVDSSVAPATAYYGEEIAPRAIMPDELAMLEDIDLADLGELPDIPAPTDEPSAAKVSDLEREMARLLGEITGRRNG